MALTVNSVITQVSNSPLATAVGLGAGFGICYLWQVRKWKKKANSGPMANM